MGNNGSGPVAQLVRALRLHRRCHRFESGRAHGRRCDGGRTRVDERREVRRLRQTLRRADAHPGGSLPGDLVAHLHRRRPPLHRRADPVLDQRRHLDRLRRRSRDSRGPGEELLAVHPQAPARRLRHHRPHAASAEDPHDLHPGNRARDVARGPPDESGGRRVGRAARLGRRGRHLQCRGRRGRRQDPLVWRRPVVGGRHRDDGRVRRHHPGHGRRAGSLPSD